MQNANSKLQSEKGRAGVPGIEEPQYAPMFSVQTFGQRARSKVSQDEKSALKRGIRMVGLENIN